MDLFILATLKSEHPPDIKVKLLRNIKKTAVKTLPNKPVDEKRKTVLVCVHFILCGNEFEHTESSNILDLILPVTSDVLEDIFDTSSVESLINGIWKELSYPKKADQDDEGHIFVMGIPVSRRMSLVNLVLSNGTKPSMVQKKFHLIIQAETIKLLYDSQDHKNFASICQILTKHPLCMPPMSKGFAMCTLSIHAMSDFQFYGDEGAIPSYIQDITHIAGLLDYIWKKEPRTLIPSLEEIFKVISAEKEPSNALGVLVKYIPVQLTNTVVKQIVNDRTISDGSMYLALTRMTMWLSWPTASDAHVWILRFFVELAEAKKFSMLIDVTIKSCKQVFTCLRYPVIRQSALLVVIHMLMSYRISPDIFHSIIPLIPKMFQEIEAEKNSDSNEKTLKILANMCYCQMYLHTGFPELYTSILKAVEKYPRPKRKELDEALEMSSWSSCTQSTFEEVEHFHFGVRSKETDRAGLVNMGNTCYMNSIIQALFMANGFRFNILKHAEKFPANSKIRMFEKTFANLLLTKRIAYEPKELVEFSRPSWFASGAQQDCSEYLKYVLDQFSEEEKQLLQPTDSNNPDVNAPIEIQQVAMETNSQQETTTTTTSTTNRGVISNLFHGESKITIVCSTCRSHSSRVESFVDIALPLDVAGETPTQGKGGCMTGDPPNARSSDAPSGGSETTTYTGTKVFNPENNQGTSAFVEDMPLGGFPVQSRDDVNEDADDVTVTTRSHDLLNLIGNYLDEERMEGDNKYFCSQCQQLQDAVKHTELTELPTYLVITLMRFTYDTREQRRTKIVDKVRIQPDINVPLNGSTEQQQSYKLWAIVVHSGASAESGHYYCYARSLPDQPDTWYLFNDSHVTLTTYSSIEDLSSTFLRDTAYVLMYRKVEGAESELLSMSVDGHDLVSRQLMAAIEDDNKKFMSELLNAKNQASNLRPNVLGWDNEDPPPPPPSCGGGDGGNSIQGSRLVC